MDGLKSMSRSCFDADALMHELYNKSWLGRFTLQQVEKKEQVERMVVNEEIARVAERKAAAAKAAAKAGGGDDAEEAAALRETIASRVQRLSLTLGEEDSSAMFGELRGSQADDDDDDDDDDDADAIEEDAATDGWQPRAYLLKRSPKAAGGSLTDLFKKWTWQKRWFVVTEADFSWYASSEAESKGEPPLGSVPRSMVLTARQSDEGGCFEVDLGNRLLTLALHGVDGARHDAHVLQWIDALNNQQVIGEGSNAALGHRGKFWKPDKAPKSPPKSSKKS